MSFLYVTADVIGAKSGGGVVTWNESEALKELGPCEVWGREELHRGMNAPLTDDPFWWDRNTVSLIQEYSIPKNYHGKLKLAHIYAGCFSETVQELQDLGCRIVYTAAAHDVELSRREHEKLGVPFLYEHLTNPQLWERYVAGYRQADVLVCPSENSAVAMRKYGCMNRIEIIPHGVDLPKCKKCKGEKEFATGPNDITDWEYCPQCSGSGIEPPAPSPKRFVVGYLGAYGPDKGIIYLLRAWRKLNYPVDDAVLVLAGKDSQSQFVLSLIREVYGGKARYGGGTFGMDQIVTETEQRTAKVVSVGWIDNVSDFYNDISLYVQPSVTEGFGCEVLEAMSHSRTVLCSRGAGAADVIPEMTGLLFDPANPDDLAEKIDFCKKHDYHVLHGPYSGASRSKASEYTWTKIRKRYQEVWRSLLGEN